MKSFFESPNDGIARLTGIQIAALCLLLLGTPLILYLCIAVAKRLKYSMPLFMRSRHFARWERKQSDRVAFMIRCGIPRSVALATVLSDAVREMNLQIDTTAVHSGLKSAWMRSIANELVDMIQSSSINSNERQSAEHSVKLFSEAELMRAFRKLQNV